MAQQAYAPLFVRRALAAAPALRRLVWMLEAVFLASVWATLWLLPTDAASALGRAFARRFGPRLRKQRHVLRNLAIAVPERPPAEREAIAREVWGSLGAVFAEFPHLTRIAREDEQRIELVVRGELPPALTPPRPAVFVTGHFANWEVMALVRDFYGVPVSVVYSPNSTPSVDRLILRMRRSLRCELVSRQGGVRALLRACSRGHSIAFLADTRQDDGEPVALCGGPALTTTVPARIALRFGLDLVPARVERIGAQARFRVTVGPPIAPDPALTEVREQARFMTQRVNERLSGWIREQPHEWLCTKRRWPEAAELAALNPAHSAPRSPEWTAAANLLEA